MAERGATRKSTLQQLADVGVQDIQKAEDPLSALAIDLNRLDDPDYLNSLSEPEKKAVARAGIADGSIIPATTEDVLMGEKLPVAQVRPVPKDLSDQANVAGVVSDAIVGSPGFARAYRKGLRDVTKQEAAGTEAEMKGLYKSQQWESKKNLAVAAVHQTRQDRHARSVKDIADADTVRAVAEKKAANRIEAANKMVTNFEIDPRRFCKEGYNAIGSAIAVALKGSSWTSRKRLYPIDGITTR